MATKLSCGDSHIGATALALYRVVATPFAVEMVDVSNALKPNVACTLSPAYGAHFLSDTKLAFWTGDQLGTADLSSGAPVRQTARLAGSAGTGAFSADGTKFAYRVYDDAGGLTTHLLVNGSDRTLYVQAPMGGHGGPGPSFGPFDQLAFSPDGSLLLDYTFRPPSGPATLNVFKADGSIAFQTSTAPGAIWSPIGNTLFFYVPSQSGLAGELDRLRAGSQPEVVASGLHGMYWARMSPDGRKIIYNVSDNSVPDCGGVPHLWSLDLPTGRATQISSLISSGPNFVQPTVVWSDEQRLAPCGPGGPSAEDAVILAHDLVTGKDAVVDTSLIPAQSGGLLASWNLLDTWFAS